MVSRTVRKAMEHKVFGELMESEFSKEQSRLSRTERRDAARAKAKLIARSLASYQEGIDMIQQNESEDVAKSTIMTVEEWEERKKAETNVD